MTFEIVYIDPQKLIPYERNAKKHDASQIRDLANAFKKRGFDQPITVDANLVIITGHGRREAAILAGLASVPVIIRDDLSEEEVKAKRLEDNRLASTDYDAILLQSELDELLKGGEDVYGFTERELSVLATDMTEFMATDDIVDDLGIETERARTEHESVTASVAAEDVRLVDAFGFKTLPAGSAILIGDFMALIEGVTGKRGGEALVAHAQECVDRGPF